jgi:hypothetical protein
MGQAKKDAWLIKTDANGHEEWNKTFGGEGDDAANSVGQTSDGDYIIAGYTESYGAGKHDVWLIKTDEKGIELWNRTFEGIKDDEANSVRQTYDGGYILAGTKSYGPGGSDVWLINVSGAPVEKAPAASLIPTGVPARTPTEKAAGFEVFLAITILLAATWLRKDKSSEG